MTLRERDQLLTKEINLFPFDNTHDDRTLGKFFPKESRDKNKSVIFYQPNLSTNETFAVAAHEMFHAGRFWANKKHPIFPIVQGAVAGSLGSLIGSYCAGTAGNIIGISAAIGAIYIYNGIKSKEEEFSASRFGNLFNPDCYNLSHNPFIDNLYYKEDFKEKITSFLQIYPSNLELVSKYAETKKECVGGNILFPKSDIHKEFNEWKKSADYKSIIGTLYSDSNKPGF
jgi:hypothetical protein